MSITNRDILKLWDEFACGSKKPQIAKGLWGDSLFYTLDDSKSIFTFVTSSRIQINMSKTKKSKTSAYITLAVPKKYCKEVRKNGDAYWLISDETTPLTISCPSSYNKTEDCLRKIAAYLDSVDDEELTDFTNN